MQKVPKMEARSLWIKQGDHQPPTEDRPWNTWRQTSSGDHECMDLYGAGLGWQPFWTWQDAPFFGVFTNNKLLMVLCCCEGDWSLCEAATPEAYNQLIDEQCAFYEEGQILTKITTAGAETVRQDRGCHYSPPRAPSSDDQCREAFREALNP
jgi:hypothetical protein